MYKLKWGKVKPDPIWKINIITDYQKEEVRGSRILLTLRFYPVPLPIYTANRLESIKVTFDTYLRHCGYRDG